MDFRHATGVLLILTATILPAIAQNHPVLSRESYYIAGTVHDDSDQHAMESVRVDLMQATGTPINTTYTRGNGDFEFSGIPNGDYTIDITVRDYEPYRETVTINHSERRGLAVFLRRPKTLVTTNYSGTISAHELSIPHKPYDEFEKGLSLIYSKSDYKGAIVQFDRAIADFPNFYEAYAQEGTAYTFLGQTAPAEEAMRKSIALSSNQYSEPFFLLAGLLNNTKRYADAEPIARQGVELEKSSWRGHFELARALSALKKTEEAEKSASQARDLKPDNPAVYLLLGNIHIQLRDHVALEKDLDQYLKISPTGPEAEQVRKTKNDLQVMIRNEQNQGHASSQSQPGSDSSKPDERGPSTEQEPPLLPPLPPPQPEP